MASVGVSAGDIFVYPHLWVREHRDGEEEGRKPRESMLVVKTTDKNGDVNLFILAITGSFDGVGEAVEIPEMEKRRAGLETNKRLWVILDEYNHDILGKSYYFQPNDKRGSLSDAFTQVVLGRFMTLARGKRLKAVPRNS